MDLPDGLELPLASGAPWWYWLGGRPAIDFVNTHRERWWRNVETLVTPADLSLWLREAKLLDEPVAATAGQLRSARRLRDAINTGIETAVDRAATTSGATDEINRWLARIAFPQRLHAEDDGIAALLPTPPADPVRSALSHVALDAATLLGTDQRDRLRICASQTCSARFYDGSRAGTRRWCSMTGCGNTAKARRHRARKASRV